MPSPGTTIWSFQRAFAGGLAAVLLVAGAAATSLGSGVGTGERKPLLAGPSSAVTAGRVEAVVEQQADSFRVQVYATKEQGAAELFQSKVERWWRRHGGDAPNDVFRSDPFVTIEHAEPYYRVQVGSFATRSQAERAQSFLSREYSGAFVVRGPPMAADESSETTQTADASDGGEYYSVQLYATEKRTQAEEFRSRLRRWWGDAKTRSPSVLGPNTPLAIGYDGTYYQVRMGRFGTRQDAHTAQSFLSQRYRGAFVVQVSSSSSSGPSGRVTEAAEQDRDRETSLQNLTDTPNLSPSAVWAQIQQTTEIVERLNRDSVYTREDLSEIFSVGCSPAWPEQSRANALAIEASHYNRNLGVALEARYGQRTQPVSGQFAGGLSGTYVGLSWDLLSQGWWGNRQESDLLETRAEVARVTGRLAQIQRRETCRARRVQERLRGMVPRLLEAKIELGTYREQLLRRAYLEGEALLDTFLSAKESVQEARRRLEILRDSVHREYDPPPLEAFPPLLNLNFEGLAQANLGDSLRRTVGALERKAIDLRDDATMDTRLSVFSRYTTTRAFDNRDLEFGVRFSQPLFGALMGNDGVAEAERMELQRRQEQVALEEQRENLRTVHRRFEEDQGRAIRAHYRITSRKERIRRRLGERAIRGNEQLGDALQDATDLLSAVIEKALAYGEVYEEVGRAFNAARQPFDARYLSVHPVTTYEWRGRAGKRALYAWSETFRARSNDFLIELARARKISRLIVSAGQGTPMQKLRDLQDRAPDADIAVELLLAPNHWVRPGGIERARRRIENLNLRGSPLHLDVEPHMFDDFDQREDEFLRRYLEVLRVARRIIGDNELVVSVPLFWPDPVYREIAKIVDRAHFMAYGEMETRERASRILEVARYFAPKQRVVALRPEDYANPWKLDQAISTLQKVVEAETFALHDLESFLQFIRDEP